MFAPDSSCPASLPDYDALFAKACVQPIPWYRVMHDVLRCQMGGYPTLALAAAEKWQLAQIGIPTTIVKDWLDFRSVSLPPQEPPKRQRRRMPRLMRT